MIIGTRYFKYKYMIEIITRMNNIGLEDEYNIFIIALQDAIVLLYN